MRRAVVAIAVHPAVRILRRLSTRPLHQPRSYPDAVFRFHLSLFDAVGTRRRCTGIAADASPGAAARPAGTGPWAGSVSRTAWAAPAGTASRAAPSAAGPAQALQTDRGDIGAALQRPELRGIPQTARRHRGSKGPRRSRQACRQQLLLDGRKR